MKAGKRKTTKTKRSYPRYMGCEYESEMYRKHVNNQFKEKVIVGNDGIVKWEK